MWKAAVEGPVDCVSRDDDDVQALNKMKKGKCHGHTYLALELIAVSGE